MNWWTRGRGASMSFHKTAEATVSQQAMQSGAHLKGVSLLSSIGILGERWTDIVCVYHMSIYIERDQFRIRQINILLFDRDWSI